MMMMMMLMMMIIYGSYDKDQKVQGVHSPIVTKCLMMMMMMIMIMIYGSKPRHFEKLSKNELSVGLTSYLQTILLSVDIICRCDVTTNDMRISCVFIANQK
jgi:hypothetical protein